VGEIQTKVCPRCKEKNSIFEQSCNKCNFSLTNISVTSNESEETSESNSQNEKVNQIKTTLVSNNSESKTIRILGNLPSEYFIRLEHLDSSHILTLYAGCTFGREMESFNSFLRNYDTISRRQFILLRKPDACYYLKDTNSTNGTFVNNRKCEPNINIKINIKDIIRTGDQSFRVIDVKEEK
jgi:pSer/pThr/pTyr-binding forkhead associated (FHA) protein